MAALALACGSQPPVQPVARDRAPTLVRPSATSEVHPQPTRGGEPACDAEAITAGAKPEPGCVTRREALELGFGWFEALRISDTDSLARFMVVPSVIEGFNVVSGPEADACGGRPETNYIGGSGIERHVLSSAELPHALRCLALDNLLVGAIPTRRASGWPRDREDYRDGNVGSLGLTLPVGLVAPLQVYLPQLAPVARTHLLAQAIMADNNGARNHVALAITVLRPARVDGVYVRTSFQD